VGGQVAWPGSSLYNAAKWGIEGFCEALAAEVAPFGIGVAIVEPGTARTEFVTLTAEPGTEDASRFDLIRTLVLAEVGPAA